MLHFSQLEKILGGKNLQFSVDETVQTLCVDSRKAIPGAGTIFFAIRGDRHDGHLYIESLVQAGIRQFVVERFVPEIASWPGTNFIQVESSITALQAVATFHRSQFSIPVIGITGSNGKTIIKEWLFQMLSKDRVVVKNPGSYNSQIGVPLSVWQMQSHHTLAIFEAGISRSGEMDKLNAIMRPTLGIFTNIGSAHNEGFQSLGEKIIEKSKLFDGAEVIIYCRDHEAIHQNISRTGIPTFSWGSGEGAALSVSHENGICTLVHGEERFHLTIPFTDRASLENCLHCIATLFFLGYPIPKIQQGLQTLKAVPMRLELKEGIHHCQLIDDTYNNDLGGLEISLQFLSHQHQKRNKRVVLSDILESGVPDEELARHIASRLQKNGIQHFVGIGPVLSRFGHFFPPGSSFYQTTDEFLQQFDLEQLHQEIILVKGARVYAFERIIGRLQRKVHATVMEIDLNALIHNFNFFKSTLQPATKIMVMVKAFAYGSGSTEIANILQYHQADYLGVAYADEGVELRKNNIALPIMVMNPSAASFEVLLSHHLEPEVYSLSIFRALLKFLDGKKCTIHLKVDTGMHRLGFAEADIAELREMLSANPNIVVASIFSHLAAADDTQQDTFSRNQFDKFKSVVSQLTFGLAYSPLLHILNSAGILRFPDMQLSMVRLGIGLYGIDPTDDRVHDLRPVATLKTLISQIKQISPGETIGYGRKGVASSVLRIATIAIGYADGYNRALSGGVGEVLIKGKRAKVIGNVCMDMTMVDVTDLDAEEGDEVILFGQGLPIQEVAEKIRTIPYEILTNTSGRVKRVFLADGI